MVYKLTKDATPEQLKAAGLGSHYANHDKALFYNNAEGVPWTASYIQAKGDPIADLYEDIAAEEKARATYQWLIDMTDDVDLQDGLKFLREREIVHAQRFMEAVEILKADRDTKKIFAGAYPNIPPNTSAPYMANMPQQPNLSPMANTAHLPNLSSTSHMPNIAHSHSPNKAHSQAHSHLSTMNLPYVPNLPNLPTMDPPQ